MKQRSLKTKLLLLTLGLFLASGVAMTWIQSSSLNGCIFRSKMNTYSGLK